MALSLRKVEYLRYLESDHWKLVRENAFFLYKKVCRECGSGKDLQVHHKSYPENLYNTNVDIVEILCRKCHCEIHNVKFEENPESERKNNRVEYLTTLLEIRPSIVSKIERKYLKSELKRLRGPKTEKPQVEKLVAVKPNFKKMLCKRAKKENKFLKNLLFKSKPGYAKY